MKRIKTRKLSNQTELDRKTRRTWTLRPVTQVRQSKKLYTRKYKHKDRLDEEQWGARVANEGW